MSSTNALWIFSAEILVKFTQKKNMLISITKSMEVIIMALDMKSYFHSKTKIELALRSISPLRKILLR